MKLAIHQPNFIPWIGFFHRLSQVDKFVFFNHVQKDNGKSWINRNKLIISNKPSWLTVPIKKKGHSFNKISEVEINYEAKQTRSILKSIELSYKKSSYFNEVYNMLNDIFEKEYRFIYELNQDLIKTISGKLGFELVYLESNKFLSDDQKNLKGNDLVLEIAKTTFCTSYLSGKGCLDFINPQSFEDQGILFKFHDFDHPTYTQFSSISFTSNLSIIDALFNLGFNNTRKILLSS